MASFVVEGGRTLSGSIRPAGNKNAALPCIAAALLTEEPVVLENVPRILDVETLVAIAARLGAAVEWLDATTLRIEASRIGSGSPMQLSQAGSGPPSSWPAPSSPVSAG